VVVGGSVDTEMKINEKKGQYIWYSQFFFVY